MPFFKFGEIAKNDYVCIIFEIWMLMAEYRSKYRGEEIDALLDKIAGYSNPETPENGGGGNNWELIETITLGEGVSVIQKSTEANGNAYAFKNIAVVMYNVTDSSWKSQIRFTINFNKNVIKGSLLPSNQVLAFRDNCTFANSNVKMMFRLVDIHNVLQIGITNPITNPGYLNAYQDWHSSDVAINNVGAVISIIQLYSPTRQFLPNTKFEIYAIR